MTVAALRLSHVGDARLIYVINCYGIVMSVVDELRKLAELKRDQLIGDEEYEDVKRSIIGGSHLHDSLDEKKGIEFYASAVNAWLAYRQEANKQLLLLSSGALALLVSIVSPESEPLKEYGFYFFLVMGCALAFFVCLSSSLLELKYSPSYLKSIITDDSAECIEKLLLVLEKISNWAFWLGAVGLFVLVFYNLL